MFPRRFHIFMETYLFFASHTGASGVLYDAKRRRFYTTTISKLQARLTEFLLAQQFFFGVIRCVQTAKGSSFESNICAITTLALIMPITAHFSQTFQPHGTAELCNMMYHYAAQYRRELPCFCKFSVLIY